MVKNGEELSEGLRSAHLTTWSRRDTTRRANHRPRIEDEPGTVLPNRSRGRWRVGLREGDNGRGVFFRARSQGLAALPRVGGVARDCTLGTDEVTVNR